MSELNIVLEYGNPVVLWGAQNENFELIKKRFPKLKIVPRGDEIKVLGDPQEAARFQGFLNLVLDHIETYQTLSPEDILNILAVSSRSSVTEGGPSVDTGLDTGLAKGLDAHDSSPQIAQSGNSDSERGLDKRNGAQPAQSGTSLAKSGKPGVPGPSSAEPIVFGPKGLIVKARTPNQRRLVDSVFNNDIVFAIGPAGTGKTYTAVALAVRALRNKEIKRIILTRPAVEAGENLGFLPGDLKEKIDPYLRPLYDALDDMIPAEKLKGYLENRTIEVAPLAFMRGRTLDNCFVILDEAQNATDMQLKMFLTRMGPTAKFIITGDVTQIDLPKKQQSGLENAIKRLGGIEGIDIIFLSGEDVVRHKLVRRILKAYGDI